jgi:hypothetical protein
MDWRLPIEQQKPVAPSATERHAEQNSSFIESDEYRSAARDPDLIEHAIHARAIRESMRHEGRKL